MVLQESIEVSELENCTTCRNSMQGDINTSLETPYLCVRKPPKIFVVGTPGGFANVTAFPQVTNKMICMRYDAKPVILEIVDPATH